MLHLKQFHPDNDHYGFAPLEAAASAIDLHNTSAAWNKALLDNAARPSGALVYTSRDGHLSGEQYERLKAELESGFQGATNAGRPLLLEGGLDWKSMSLSPKDMDFIEARHVAAREIALALGVPPMLLGIPGDNTYANMAEAQRILWRQTVIPLVTRIADALTSWLGASDAYFASAPPSQLRLIPDIDAIEALAPEREALWSRLEKTSFLTSNEKRAAIGYAPLADADAKFNPNHDALGRFTFGDGDNPSDGSGNSFLHPVAKRPKSPSKDPTPEKQPIDPKKPVESTAPRIDPGSTPGGQRLTKHGREQATDRNFTDKNIDDIVQNNRRISNGVDDQGRKTWRHTDSRGNTVILNEEGGVVSVFSTMPGGPYIPKP